MKLQNETIEAIETGLRRRIESRKERINCLQRLAPLAGKYITKRLEPEIKEIFSEFPTAYISKDQYSGKFSVVLSRPGWNIWYDAHWLIVCNNETRRIDPAMIAPQIEETQKEIEKLSGMLENIRDQIVQFSNLMAYAQTLAAPICSACNAAINGHSGMYAIENLLKLAQAINWN